MFRALRLVVQFSVVPARSSCIAGPMVQAKVLIAAVIVRLASGESSHRRAIVSTGSPQ